MASLLRRRDEICCLLLIRAPVPNGGCLDEWYRLVEIPTNQKIRALYFKYKIFMYIIYLNWLD